MFFVADNYFPPESLLVGFSSEQSAYYYISGKGNNDNTTKIDGKSSTLVIELTDNGAVTPYLLIKKEYNGILHPELYTHFII